MRRKRSLRELETLGEFMASGLEAADEIGGPITQCIAYKATGKKRKDGKPVMRCAQFYPTHGEEEKDATKWVNWKADNRVSLRRPHRYFYKESYVVSPEYKPTRAKKEKKAKKAKKK